MNDISIKKHIHVVGISGVATSALAIALDKAGFKITGSDKGFFPPASTELEKQGIKYYAGWHVEKMIETGVPDILIVGTASGSKNPETLYAQENNIPIYSFAEAIGKFFLKEKSIVVTGTWGKTSSSALLSYIFDKAGFDPTYMFGGISLSHQSSARLSNSSWSIFEGDEYKSSPTDNTAKFFYYKPTHILLTAVSWDHADLYPTEESYFNTFRKLVSSLPSSGLVVANSDNPGVNLIIGSSNAPVITYGSKKADYIFSKVEENKNGINFKISFKDRDFIINSSLLGSFQAENITGCFAMAHTLGIEPDKIISAIHSFKGLKRRLEKRLDSNLSPKGITVFDDIAHSPEKASSVLKTLRTIYTKKIFTIFEPNIGGRRMEAADKYNNAFENSDFVIIPKLTNLKTTEDPNDMPIDGKKLTEIISKTHPHCTYIDDDEMLVDLLTSHTEKDDVIAFLGSHGFRKMIEATVERLS